MVFFGIKPKVNTESFCKYYYDSQIFGSIVDDNDTNQKILDATFQQLSDSDSSFLKVDRAVFKFEMTAMHLELFALAFLKCFSDFNKAVQHSIFTLRYIQNKNRIGIWKAMSEYNLVIAQTATMNANGRQMTGDSAIERMTITRVNELRFSSFKKYLLTYFSDLHNLTADGEDIAGCVVRVCNHMEADILRDNEIGIRRITSLFLNRLGLYYIGGKHWQPSDDFLLIATSQPYSMYDFATRMLKNVDL